MSSDDIELDEVEVVEVAGKAHHDGTRAKKKRCAPPSLRCATLIIFIVMAIIYVAGVAVGNVLMFNSLDTLDMRAANASINRFTWLMQYDMLKMQDMVKSFGKTDAAVASIQNLISHPEMDPEDAVFSFVRNYLNTTAVYDQEGKQTGVKYGVDANFWALLDKDYKTKYSLYYPNGPAGAERSAAPKINPGVFKSIVADLKVSLRLLIPNEGDDKLMFVSVAPITNASGTEVQGYLVAGRSLSSRLQNYADNAPICLVIQDGRPEPGVPPVWDDVDRKMFATVASGTFGNNKSFTGVPDTTEIKKRVFLRRDTPSVQKTPGRICPTFPVYEDAENSKVGYVNFCDLDPDQYKDVATCFLMRVDRPQAMVDMGNIRIISLSLEVGITMFVLGAVFLALLDFFVLRRIVNLSNVIKQQGSQTQGDKDEKEEEEDKKGSKEDDQEDLNSEARGKSGKSSKAKSGTSASGTSEGSYTSHSSDFIVTTSTSTRHRSKREEIESLKSDMEQNALGLRKRLDDVNNSIKSEQQKNIRHKQGMQLLNLWRGRKDYFPGLRPNALQLRYEPSRNVDDLLSNPLAIEYLKTHCASDHTLENVWFILDVSWLQELEAAEDKEDDMAKRHQIHDVAACTAKTIMERYICENAPQMVNLSAGTFKKLRESGDQYTRHMFDEALGEVKMMLTTDIIPRFQTSMAYSAMSETLYVDTSGEADESEFSDETVSTAGSILTDATEEGAGGVAQVFAHTFKNLNTAFEVDHNASTVSTSTTSGAAASSSIVVSAPKKEEPKKEEPKKEEPKKEEPKKEEPKKEESKEEESEEGSESGDSGSSGSGSGSSGSGSGSSGSGSGSDSGSDDSE